MRLDQDIFDEDFETSVSEIPGTNEGIEDVELSTAITDVNAVLSATDWTTETIISQINKGNIQLDPKFQRREAWNADRKSRYIESLILGMPIPQLVLAESKIKRGAYIVIDGKQRLLSIRQFAADTTDTVFKPLRLTGLGNSAVNGKNLADLISDPLLKDELSTFENQSIRTVVIKGWTNEKFLYQVFLRLNTGSVALSPQELRQALHPGPFLDYTDQRSADSEALRDLLSSNKPDFRMRDVELLVRYYAFQNFFARYSGDMKGFLDITCQTLNTSWPSVENELRRQGDEFEVAYSATRLIFDNHPFRRWTGTYYQKPYNRAIFDIMMFFFANKEIRESAIDNKEAVESAFKHLCIEDTEFAKSIEVSTKSMNATYARFSTWSDVLRRILPIPVPEVNLVEKRIVVGA